MTPPQRRRAAALAIPALLASCAVSAPPPSPDPFVGGARQEGALGRDASPSQAAFCVSQGVPLSHVLLTTDGAAVRPAPGSRAAGDPDYALTLRQSEAGTTWLRQVGDADAARAAFTAYRLDRALAGCAPAPGDGA